MLIEEYETEKNLLLEEKNKKIAELHAIQTDLDKIDELIRNSQNDREKFLTKVQDLQSKQLNPITEQINTLRESFGISTSLDQI